MNSGKSISAGFLIAGVYGLFRFLIFEAAFKWHIEENPAAHIAFTIVVVGFVVLGVKLIPEKYIGPLFAIPSIALVAFFCIGMSCCYDSCTEKGDKDNSIQQGAKVEIPPPVKSQETTACSNSKNIGRRVAIPPPEQMPKEINWGYPVTQDLENCRK